MITQQPSQTPNKAQQLQIERKYGMFIHFGINTFNNTEWSDGTLPASSYSPVQINADQWVKTAYLAGMEYVILISKHHDGFTLWNSKYTDYGVGSSSNKTDVVREVANACEKYGIKLGIYYSLWDRHEPCYNDDEAYVQYMINQLTELMDGTYGEIVELWLDGGWDKRSEQWGLDRVYNCVKQMQPNCVMGVNLTIGEYNSLGMNGENYKPCDYQKGDSMKYFPSDFRLWDPNFTREGIDADPKIYSHNGEEYYLPFEATICVRNMKNWFWDPLYTSEPTVTPRFIADKYLHLTNQNNALVVNCGPNMQGEIEEYDRQTLFEAARMLNIKREE